MAQNFIVSHGSREPKKIGEVLKNYFETSNEPLAIAHRRRMATMAYAEKGDTTPCLN